uniref:Ovule protein n=1 Tax=Mesocestoides corti TaxID=53468 RepID=A0A5K3EWN7_MESCO
CHCNAKRQRISWVRRGPKCQRLYASRLTIVKYSSLSMKETDTAEQAVLRNLKPVPHVRRRPFDSTTALILYQFPCRFVSCWLHISLT